MKQNIFLSVLFMVCLAACHLLPSDKGVKEGHFRVANLTDDDINSTVAHIYTMCHNHKPASWTSAREFPSGDQTLWVKATIQQIGIVQSYREAHVRFTMDFPEGGNFQLAHKIEHNNISIWLQDPDSQTPKSTVITTKLKPNTPASSESITHQCNKASI